MEIPLITFRHMEPDDLEQVLNIILAHDEDDAEEAEKNYQQNSVDGQYVMLLDEQIIGVSGARLLDDCDNSFSLSWTYVDKQHCRKGYGRQMLQHVLDELKTYNARKVFVYVSDYRDESGNNIYAGALHLYQACGFEIELKIADYYDEDEALTVLGLLLQKKEQEQEQEQEGEALTIKPESPKVKFNQLIHIAETESAYNFGWQTKRFGYNFRAQDILTGLDAAHQSGATIVLISFPSNYQNVKPQLNEAGFREVGQLTDYYENGVHEVHYEYRF
ncbi:MAG: ribosomal protein S18 acetylase RimI-like enzyme [Phenylobacterium sp.]|jgi:ribosomal protein S18 acetylase RimI-like enzyme